MTYIIKIGTYNTVLTKYKNFRKYGRFLQDSKIKYGIVYLSAYAKVALTKVTWFFIY